MVSISDVRPPKGCVWLAVESIDSPGNLGTIIRTAEATGVTGIVVIGANADPYEPTAIRAGMGSLFSQRLSALLGQGIYGLGEDFRRRSCGFFAEPGCSTIGPSAADGLRRS
jgi:TrmH family RNA methyltransferase